MTCVAPGDAGGVQVWITSVADALAMPGGFETLDADDWSHANRLRQAADRDRCLAGRVLLRYALSQSVGMGIAPGEWRFRKGPNGKPLVTHNQPPLQFNVSHSFCCLAVAVAKYWPVGIDIESLAPENIGRPIDDVLTDRERAWIYGHPEVEQAQAFLRLWTIKEACAKALALDIVDFRQIEAQITSAPAVHVKGEARTLNVTLDTVFVDGRPYSLSIAARC